MAKKMVEEIILAESEAEKLVAQSYKKAEEIIKAEQISAKQKADQIISAAKLKAEELHHKAQEDTSQKLDEAKALADNELVELREIFNKNLENAVETAIGILAE